MHLLAASPLSQAYPAAHPDYLPGGVLLFEFLGRTFGGNDVRFVVKATAIAFDLLAALATYLIALRLFDRRRALVACAFYTLNPALIYDCAVWGQIDAVPIAFTLFAILCVLRRWRVMAWALLAAAVLLKPMVVLLAPLLIIEAGHRHWKQTAGGIAAGLAVTYAICAPVLPDRWPLAVFGSLLDQAARFTNVYPYTTVNAFNAWALVDASFQSDTGGKALAEAAFATGTFVLYAAYAWKRDGQGLLKTSCLLLLAMFLFLPEMHERYMIYGVALLPVLAVQSRRYLAAGIALSVAQLLNLEYGLLYLHVTETAQAHLDVNALTPVLARVCALVSIAAFGALVA